MSCTAHQLAAVELALPLWRYTPAFASGPYSALLDSALDPAGLGRHSFLAAEPFLAFRAWCGRERRSAAGAVVETTRLRDDDGRPLARPQVDRRVADPFLALRQLLAAHRVERWALDPPPAPFLAGAIGYFGYGSRGFIPELPDADTGDPDLPDACFLFFDAALVESHADGKVWLSVVGRGPDQRAARRRAAARSERLRDRLRAFERSPEPAWEGPTAVRRASVRLEGIHDETSYAALVGTAQERISAGDVYQVCLTHRLSRRFDARPWDLYRELRRVNPAPFAAYFELPEAAVVSASPERFLRLGADRTAESRPIKGTRRRGTSEVEDERLRRELVASAKDRAENVMIVDLVRNDLGRVCRTGTVTVPELLTVERYATVFQLVSTVRGELAAGRDGLDLIRAAFPGGSMTGAPKIAAMAILDQLERDRRGVYSGALGYLGFSGTLDLAMVIRTIVVQAGRARFGVGGGIVADSDPRGEYAESMDKARALVTALDNVAASREEGAALARR